MSYRITKQTIDTLRAIQSGDEPDCSDRATVAKKLRQRRLGHGTRHYAWLLARPLLKFQ